MSSSLAAHDAAYEVRAFNTAAASENKIYDDAVARRFGFRGALVPGVEVYAYMAHVPVGRWGRAWLESSAADCRFLKPVYDGAAVRVTAGEESGGLALSVESTGERCATGHAFMPSDRRPAPPVDALRAGAPPAGRPPASERGPATGLWDRSSRDREPASRSWRRREAVTRDRVALRQVSPPAVIRPTP